MSTGTELVAHERTPMEVIALMAEKGVDLQNMERMFDLQERWEKHRAAEAFAAALVTFQQNCPVIGKDRTATIRSAKGEYKYQFASFDDVMIKITPALKLSGIGINFSTEPAGDNAIKCTCRIRHGMHFEDHTLTVPVPAMTVNDTQRYGAALKYAKRYCLEAALNLVTTDEPDTDAENLYETIDEKQVAQLEEWIATSGANRQKFLETYQIERLSDMPATMFLTAIGQLQRKAKQAR